jgi:hypothetical protein
MLQKGQLPKNQSAQPKEGFNEDGTVNEDSLDLNEKENEEGLINTNNGTDIEEIDRPEEDE